MCHERKHLRDLDIFQKLFGESIDRQSGRILLDVDLCEFIGHRIDALVLQIAEQGLKEFERRVWNRVLNGAGGVFNNTGALSVLETFTLVAGTVTQNAQTLSVSSYTQTGGVFVGGGANITLSGMYSLAAGATFYAPTANIVAGSSWTVRSPPIGRRSAPTARPASPCATS